MAGASNLDRRKSAASFIPAFNPVGNEQAYIKGQEHGISVVTETVITNSAAVTAVAHSLGVTPGFYTVQVIGGGAAPVSILEHSAANNSVIGLRGYTHSTTNQTNVTVRVAFFPPQT